MPWWRACGHSELWRAIACGLTPQPCGCRASTPASNGVGYAYDLQPEPMERLRALSIALWPEVRSELNAFQGWLTRASS